MVSVWMRLTGCIISASQYSRLPGSRARVLVRRENLSSYLSYQVGGELGVAGSVQTERTGGTIRLVIQLTTGLLPG